MAMAIDPGEFRVMDDVKTRLDNLSLDFLGYSFNYSVFVE